MRFYSRVMDLRCSSLLVWRETLMRWMSYCLESVNRCTATHGGKILKVLSFYRNICVSYLKYCVEEQQLRNDNLQL